MANVRMTRLGWMWDDPLSVRRSSPIPQEMRLSHDDVVKMFPHFDPKTVVEETVRQYRRQEIERVISWHEFSCREYGLAEYTKVDATVFIGFNGVVLCPEDPQVRLHCKITLDR
jgi:hypothetical protein